MTHTKPANNSLVMLMEYMTIPGMYEDKLLEKRAASLAPLNVVQPCCRCDLRLAQMLLVLLLASPLLLSEEMLLALLPSFETCLSQLSCSGRLLKRLWRLHAVPQLHFCEDVTFCTTTPLPEIKAAPWLLSEQLFVLLSVSVSQIVVRESDVVDRAHVAVNCDRIGAHELLLLGECHQVVVIFGALRRKPSMALVRAQCM